MPTYHLASCADDIDLRISHIIRGQDHLSNTYKHVLIFEGAGAKPPQFAHLPLLVAPDGSKLSKRRHGPVVSVTTYRDAGFLPEAFINFLCLLGWSPKDDREKMTRQELTDAFSLEGINRANAVINFKEPAATPDETFDPKAVWLNAEHIRGLSVDDLSARLLPVVQAAGIFGYAGENARHYAADPRAHQASARRSNGRRLFLRGSTPALRSSRTHSRKRATRPWRSRS
jgi:glutamyl-tRNA synthetase